MPGAKKKTAPSPNCGPIAGCFVTAIKSGAVQAPNQAADWMLEACLPFGPWVTSNLTF